MRISGDRSIDFYRK